MPTLRFLGDLPFARIHAALQAAFADYAVDVSYMTRDYLERRSRKNGVDLSVSPGVFEGDDLVGLTLVGVGPWRGGLGAFDAGTGLVQAFRGRGLASAMFEFALPALRARGVGAFLLDVLQTNEPAIRAYRKAGFAVVRGVDCLERPMGPDLAPRALPAGLVLERVGPEALEPFERGAEWPLSWECSWDSQRRVGADMVFLRARAGDDPAGLAAFYPDLGWLMAFQVRPAWRRRGVGAALVTRVLAECARPGQRIRADNLDAGDRGSRAFLEGLGFRHSVSQYEMARRLD